MNNRTKQELAARSASPLEVPPGVKRRAFDALKASHDPYQADLIVNAHKPTLTNRPLRSSVVSFAAASALVVLVAVALSVFRSQPLVPAATPSTTVESAQQLTATVSLERSFALPDGLVAVGAVEVDGNLWVLAHEPINNAAATSQLYVARQNEKELSHYLDVPHSSTAIVAMSGDIWITAFESDAVVRTSTNDPTDSETIALPVLPIEVSPGDSRFIPSALAANDEQVWVLTARGYVVEVAGLSGGVATPEPLGGLPAAVLARGSDLLVSVPPLGVFAVNNEVTRLMDTPYPAKAILEVDNQIVTVGPALRRSEAGELVVEAGGFVLSETGGVIVTSDAPRSPTEIPAAPGSAHLVDQGIVVVNVDGSVGLVSFDTYTYQLLTTRDWTGYSIAGDMGIWAIGGGGSRIDLLGITG